IPLFYPLSLLDALPILNEFVRPTLVLAIICLVITALLSVSHEITQPIIDENERKTAEIARAEVLTEADSFEQIEGEFPEGVQERSEEHTSELQSRFDLV